MSIPNEALQKLLFELEQSAQQAQQQITSVRQQIVLKNRESRMLQLTTSELDGLPAGTNVYEGVGKMFVLTPTQDVKRRITTDSTDVKNDVSNLEKKMRYLETTFEKSRENLDKILKGSSG